MRCQAHITTQEMPEVSGLGHGLRYWFAKGFRDEDKWKDPLNLDALPLSKDYKNLLTRGEVPPDYS